MFPDTNIHKLGQRNEKPSEKRIPNDNVRDPRSKMAHFQR
jgi:hypothetical protein